MRTRTKLKLTSTTILSGLSLISAPAWAQTEPAAPAPTETAAAEEADMGADITVTARRRDESIVDVPLAITVVSAEKLDRLNIRSTTDLANFVPGLQFSDFTPGNSRNDRGGNRPLIFRGLNLAGNGGVTGAGSMFLDGAAVIGNEIPGGYDIGAVEVLRGPQNVYFGRASMTGAVSYRTRAIPDDLTLEANATLAERGTYRFEVSGAGMVVPELLGVRLTGLIEKTGGFITNAYKPDGKKFGERKRQSISATVDFTPMEALEVKLYGNYFQDEDGISATVNIFPDSLNGTGQVTNCLRGIPAGANNTVTPPIPNAPARPTICGKVPPLSRAVAYSRTDIPANHAATLFSVPFLKGEGFDQQPGLQRNVFNAHAVINYDISDYLKFQSITGYHENAVLQVVDGIQQPPAPPGLSRATIVFFGLYNKFRDFSQEFRLSSDPEKAFSWTIGGNYVNARNLSAAANTLTNNPVAPAVPAFTGAVFPVGDDRAKTYGVFAGAYLKLMEDRLTVSAEGRYQIDKRRTLSIPIGAAPLVDAADEYKSFNPRVSLDYDVGNDRKVYASFARGSRPGGFNTGFVAFFNPNNPLYLNGTANFATATAAIRQQFGDTKASFDEEQLDIYELGFKGNLAEGKGYFDINLYYGNVTNQQTRLSSAVQLSPTFTTTIALSENGGKTEIYGVEFTGNYNFTRDLSLNTTFAYNQTKRIRFTDNSPGNIRLYGRTSYAGLELPNAPEISGSAVVSYEQAVSPDWSPFGSVAFVYRGRQWADIANFAYIPGRATVDLRVGAKNEMFRIEGFVTNLFNNKTYPGGNVASDFGANRFAFGGDQGFYGAYADPQTFGVRASVKF